MIGERLCWHVGQIGTGVANAFIQVIHSFRERVSETDMRSFSLSRFLHIISFFADLSQVLQIHSIQYMVTPQQNSRKDY